MHSDFILSNIMDVLEDGIQASASIHGSISHYPLCEYLLQGIFLRLTGYQEQKLKCIMWELATHDFSLRYRYLSGQISIGECSRLEDKNKVLLELLASLESCVHAYTFPDTMDIEAQIDAIRNKLKYRLEHSIFAKWLPRDYNRFVSFVDSIHAQEKGYFSSKNCFGTDSKLQEAYDKVFIHRNRCAHNLFSYQNNVPTLLDVTKDLHGSDNYFSRIFILALIDNIFVQVFNHFYKYVLHR